VRSALQAQSDRRRRNAGFIRTFSACETIRGNQSVALNRLFPETFVCGGAFRPTKGLMKNKWLMILLLTSLLAAGAGCAVLVVGGAAAAGAGGYAYVNGESKATEAASLDRTWNATLAAMKDLEFPVTSQRKDALQAELTARNASDKKIAIQLKKVSDSATEIHIRVGTFGDETVSRVIFDKINKAL